MRRYLVAAVAALSLTAIASDANAQARSRIGGLTCSLAPTVGLIIGSQTRANCVFRSSRGGPNEYYTATISRIGIDLGVTSRATLIWGVFARTTALPPRSLAGTYVGASGDAALGLGAGANVLVGGSNRTISLQPLSVQGQVGVNIALGVAGMTLR